MRQAQALLASLERGADVTVSDLMFFMPPYAVYGLYLASYRGLGDTPLEQLETALLFMASGVDYSEFLGMVD